jgi:protein required for attachment to host cells
VSQHNRESFPMSHRHTPRHAVQAWIVVADRSRARIFSTAWPMGEHLTEVEDLIDESGLLSERDTLTDAPTSFVSNGKSRHRGEPQTDFAHRTAHQFSRRIAERLEQGRQSQAYGRLVLVAPPMMLGELRQALSRPVAKLVTHELSHDYTQLTANQIAEHLAAKLTNPLASAPAAPV